MSKKVGLLDLDAEKRRRVFPNLALMKLSSYHKAMGDEVYLNFPLCNPDITYASCVFTWHKPEFENPRILYGGSGINFTAHLRDEMEHIMPDYSLYPGCDWSMGFTSRGCPNHCPFCSVREKEGNIKATTSVREFYNPIFRRLLLLDNNIFASENWDETANDLITLQVEVDFNQGLDIRRLDEKKVNQLRQMRIKTLRFAFDDVVYEESVVQGIKLLLKSGFRPRNLSFYVLVGYKQDDKAIERMKLLQSWGVEVYPMLYKDASGKEPDISYDYKETIQFRGARLNLRKFLRAAGRLT